MLRDKMLRKLCLQVRLALNEPAYRICRSDCQPARKSCILLRQRERERERERERDFTHAQDAAGAMQVLNAFKERRLCEAHALLQTGLSARARGMPASSSRPARQASDKMRLGRSRNNAGLCSPGLSP